MKSFDRIILIDDDPIFSSLTKESIESSPLRNNNVLVYMNGVRALRDFSETDLSKLTLLMFIDITMPLMDGWDFLDELDKLNMNQDNEIYILSSSVHEEDKKKALSYSKVSGYITKPLKPDTLKEIQLAC